MYGDQRTWNATWSGADAASDGAADSLRLDNGQSNVLLMTSVAAAVVGGFAWGRVVDRLGPKRTLNRVLGCWAVTLGMAALIPVAGLPPLLFFGVAALADAGELGMGLAPNGCRPAA